MINFHFNKYDAHALRTQLDTLSKKTRKKYIRQASRYSMRRHILPQVKRRTPSGGKGQRGRHINNAGDRNNQSFSAYAYTGRRSTGKLRRSWKIQALKRSRRTSGVSVASFNKETFYGKFLELGRTFNQFLPMRKWRQVPNDKRVKIPGRHMWLRVARRRGHIAQRAAIRELWRLMTKEFKARR